MKLLTLSEDKIVEEPTLLLKKLFGYFLTSDALQSNMYTGVTSLKGIMHTNANKNIAGLKSKIEVDLKNMLSRYFPTVEVSVESDSVVSGGLKDTRISIYASVTNEKGQVATLDKAVVLNDTGSTIFDGDYISRGI